jgi:hypothetical protein
MSDLRVSESGEEEFAGRIAQLLEDLHSTGGYCTRDILAALKRELEAEDTAIVVLVRNRIVTMSGMRSEGDASWGRMADDLRKQFPDYESRLRCFLDADSTSPNNQGGQLSPWLDMLDRFGRDHLLVIRGPHWGDPDVEEQYWGIAILNPNLLTTIGAVDSEGNVAKRRYLVSLVQAWIATAAVKRRNFATLVDHCGAPGSRVTPEQWEELKESLKSPRMLQNKELLRSARHAIHHWPVDEAIGESGEGSNDMLPAPTAREQLDSLLDRVPDGMVGCVNCSLQAWDFCGRSSGGVQPFQSLWRWSHLYHADTREPRNLRIDGFDPSIFEQSTRASVSADCLDHFALLRFFFAEYLQGRHFQDSLSPSRCCTSDERCTLLRNITRTAHHLLADLPLDEDMLKALMAQVSQYAYGELAISERLSLSSRFDLLAAPCDLTFPSLKASCRDDFFQSLNVCLLGHFLLNIELDPGRPMWRLVAQLWDLDPMDEHNRLTVLRGWYVAALFYSSLGAEEPQVHGDTGKDYGADAARRLQEVLAREGRLEPTLTGIEYVQAARAISECCSREFNVSFKSSPLGFLLTLCDMAQKCSRMRFGNLVSAAESHGFLREGSQGLKSAQRTISNLGFSNLSWNGSHWRLKPAKPLLLRLGYASGMQRNSGELDLWLDSTHKLQRLNFNGLEGLEFAVELETIF